MQNNIAIILVRPQFLGNLGSIARVMKNFSFSDLRLIDPPKNYKDAEARKMSVGAFDILKHATTYSSLSEALHDISLAFGTSSGKQREYQPEPYEKHMASIVQYASKNKCALVFGDEVNGMSRDDLKLCHHIVSVPTNPEFPSLNLAMCVGIMLHALFRLVEPVETTEKSECLSTGAKDDAVFKQLGNLLESAEFTRSFNRHKVLSELRSFYQRAHPTAREADLLYGALLRIANAIKVTPNN